MLSILVLVQFVRHFVLAINELVLVDGGADSSDSSVQWARYRVMKKPILKLLIESGKTNAGHKQSKSRFESLSISYQNKVSRLTYKLQPLTNKLHKNMAQKMGTRDDIMWQNNCFSIKIYQIINFKMYKFLMY